MVTNNQDFSLPVQMPPAHEELRMLALRASRGGADRVGFLEHAYRQALRGTEDTKASSNEMNFSNIMDMRMKG